MKIVGLLILCALVTSSNAQTIVNDGSVETTENQFLELLKTRMYDNLASFYDDRYQGVLETGKVVDKEKMVEFQKTVSPYITPFVEDQKFSVYENIAVTTGKLLNKTKSGAVIGQSRFIRVYVKKGADWKIIESQFTLIE